jgi:hypothetical protein
MSVLQKMRFFAVELIASRYWAHVRAVIKARKIIAVSTLADSLLAGSNLSDKAETSATASVLLIHIVAYCVYVAKKGSINHSHQIPTRGRRLQFPSHRTKKSRRRKRTHYVDYYSDFAVGFS